MSSRRPRSQTPPRSQALPATIPVEVREGSRPGRCRIRFHLGAEVADVEPQRMAGNFILGLADQLPTVVDLETWDGQWRPARESLREELRDAGYSALARCFLKNGQGKTVAIAFERYEAVRATVQATTVLAQLGPVLDLRGSDVLMHASGKSDFVDLALKIAGRKENTACRNPEAESVRKVVCRAKESGGLATLLLALDRHAKLALMRHIMEKYLFEHADPVRRERALTVAACLELVATKSISAQTQAILGWNEADRHDFD